MLVISRKVGESFVIADNIRISILASGNDKVSVGIEAPPEIKVVRTELAETIRANRESVSKMEDEDIRGIADLLKDKKVR